MRIPLARQHCFAALFLILLSSCTTSPEANEAKYLKRGEALVGKKDYARALLEFRNAAAAMPKDAEPYYQTGLVYLETSDLQGAVRAFQKATSLNSKHSGAQLKLAELMTSSRDPQAVRQAAKLLQDVFGASPNDPDAVDTLALAKWKLGQAEQASGLLEEALKKFPTHLQSAVTLARMKLSAKDWSAAEEVLKKAVADAPQSSSAAVALGDLYLYLRRPEKAEPELRKALQLDSKNAAALISLATLEMSSNRTDEAEATYRQLSALPEKAYRPTHAMFLFQTGKRDAAVTEFEALAKADPTDRDARSRLVAAYVALNRGTDAENILAAALKRNPKDADALLQQAQLHLRRGKLEDSERDLREVLHFNPNSAAAHLILADVFKAQGLGGSQRQELQKVIDSDSTLLQARLTLATSFLAANQSHAALDVLEGAPEAQKSDFRWALSRNWVLLSLGNLQEASTNINRLLQRERTPTAVFQKALLLVAEKDYIGAHAQLDELLKGGISDPNVLELLMQTYTLEKNPSKGIERLKEIAAAHPKSASIQYLLGKWCQNIGNLAGARQAFENAKALDPEFVDAELGLASLELRQGQTDQAARRLISVASTHPKNISPLMLLAKVQYESGDRAGMGASCRKILEIDSSNVDALNNLAYTLATDSPDEALKLAQHAVEIAPERPDVQDTLGWIYYRKGLYDTAARYLKTAVDKDPSPRRQFHLGMSYVKMGDPNGRKIVLEALSKDPALTKSEQGW